MPPRFHQPTGPSSRSFRGVAAAALAGIAVSALLFLTIRRWEQREVQAAVQAAAAQRIELLHEALGSSQEALHALGAFFGAQPSPDRERFRRFVDDLLARRPELLALSWTPRVPAAERAGYERRAQADGLATFTFTHRDPATGDLVPAGAQEVYYPVYFIEPTASNESALGFDLNARFETLAAARDHGRAVSTPPIRLVQEPDNQPGFIVYLPLYGEGPVPGSVEERRVRLTGFVAAVYRIPRLFDPSLAGLPGLAVTVRDVTDGAGDDYSPSPADAAPAAARLAPVVFDLPCAGREWRITFTPTAAFPSGRFPSQSWLVLGGGLLLTGLLASHLARDLRAGRRIAAANAALQAEIVERKRAEEAAAAANRAKSDFLASLSHEIRTPLNSILGYAQILERDPDLLHRHRESVVSLATSGRHLLGLLNSILDLSKVEAGCADLQRDVIDLPTLVRELADMFKPRCAEKQLALRIALPPEPPAPVIGDEGKLRQVLINLIGNAVKFTPRGEVLVGLARADDGRWRFDVIDTGIGIYRHEQAGLFGLFHQTAAGRRHGGTGLGLALARRHVELMGGSIEVESEAGVGTRFHFTLPLPVSVLPPAAALGPVPRLLPGAEIRALVVDDNRDNRIILSRLLAHIGCRVASAAGAGEAVAALADRPPDIVFVDVLLGDITGPALVVALQRAGLPAATPVVYHTAALLAAGEREALRATGGDLLAKPFRIEDLCACLQRLPGVRFEDAPEPAGPAPLEVDGLVLPADLSHRLGVAAELHSTTVLKACLDELRQLGGPAVPFADHLRRLLRSYDLASISRLIATVPVESPLASSRS